MLNSRYALLVAIFGIAVTCSLARGPKGGPGGWKGVKGNCPFPKPSFLKDLNSTAAHEFKEISFNRDLSRNQINALLDNWASSQSAEVQTSFNNWRQNITSIITELTTKADDRVSNLSSEAQDLYNKLKPVLKNDDITENNKCTEVKTILANTTTKVVRELLDAVPYAAGPCGRRGPGPHGRMQKGGRGGKRGPKSSEEDGFGRRGPANRFEGATNAINDAPVETSSV
uniref:ANIS5_cation-bd domain-containing protein n=1 Tax=Panagrellus redivivus TaxID=6233 RepID=A0A7E4UUX3_PANRE